MYSYMYLDTPHGFPRGQTDRVTEFKQIETHILSPHNMCRCSGTVFTHYGALMLMAHAKFSWDMIALESKSREVTSKGREGARQRMNSIGLG